MRHARDAHGRERTASCQREKRGTRQKPRPVPCPIRQPHIRWGSRSYSPLCASPLQRPPLFLRASANARSTPHIARWRASPECPPPPGSRWPPARRGLPAAGSAARAAHTAARSWLAEEAPVRQGHGDQVAGGARVGGHRRLSLPLSTDRRKFFRLSVGGASLGRRASMPPLITLMLLACGPIVVGYLAWRYQCPQRRHHP